MAAETDSQIRMLGRMREDDYLAFARRTRGALSHNSGGWSRRSRPLRRRLHPSVASNQRRLQGDAFCGARAEAAEALGRIYRSRDRSRCRRARMALRFQKRLGEGN